MKEHNIKLLFLWYNKCKLFYKCHRDTSDYYNFYHKLIGFPVIIINLFTSSSLFINSSDISSSLTIIIGSLSLLSTLLLGTQSYFNLVKLHEQHNKMMMEYSKILFSIEKILIMVQNDSSYDLDVISLNRILSDIEKLRETYLQFPEKIWIRHNLEFNLKLDNINLSTSDSINIIINSLKSKKEHSDESQKLSEIITYDNNLDSNKVINHQEDSKNIISPSIGV